jgi:hypothetical protein
MVIYDSTFAEVSLDPERKLVITSWFETSVKLNTEGVMNEMQAMLDSALPHKPYGIIADTRKFFVKVNQELQSWIVLNFISRLIDAGIERYAIIVTEKAFPQVAHTRVTEGNIEGFDIQYFTSLEDANEWISEAIK